MAFSLSQKDQTTLNVQFEHFVGNDTLMLDSMNYKNELGQTFTISKFKYYVGHFSLKNTDGKDFSSDEYFLIDEEEPLSKQIELKNIPFGKYQCVSFLLGVDSTSNCSGAQRGALDPTKAMFWAWNTGYIFLKMEGHAPMSKSSGHFYEYHIGGFRKPNNCIRSITLNFKDIFEISKEKNTTLHLKTDAAELLKTPTAVDFAKLSAVTDFHNATTIADNYTDMFQIFP
jgi:hypothetical protein